MNFKFSLIPKNFYFFCAFLTFSSNFLSNKIIGGEKMKRFFLFVTKVLFQVIIKFIFKQLTTEKHLVFAVDITIGPAQMHITIVR